MNFSFYNTVRSRIPKISLAIGLVMMVLLLIFSAQVSAVQADDDIPEFYRGLLNGYYVELVVDWLPDRTVEGEIWTAAHKVTAGELGFAFAKVQGDNQINGHLDLEIVGDEIGEKNDDGGEKQLGVASLKKTLTGDYIEWTGEYRRTTGEKVPMMIYRERRHLSGPKKEVGEKEGQERSPDEHGISGTGSCEEGVCQPVLMEVCVPKKSVSEARDYFEWLKFPVEATCASQGGNGCVRDSLCSGETWVLEVDGFSEPYWEQELNNLPFIISAHRTREGAGYNTGIIEMQISSFFSGTVPDHEEAVKNIHEFLNAYFSESVGAGSVTMKMRERTKFNYIIDILGLSSSLSLRKPGLWEHHQLRIMMSQPYPDAYPEKFAVYLGLPNAQFIEWTENEPPPSDKFIPIKDDESSAFLEKIVSAFAHRYRAAVWTP
jgi:hypothetical protein